MATKTTDIMEKSLDDLEKEITCAICQEHYTDPRILPCLHYYCRQCIYTLTLKKGKNKPFSCPECRKIIALPEEEEEFMSAFFINRLKSMYMKYKQALSKQVLCEMCTISEAKAEAYCRQCNKFACENCKHMHSVMKAFFDGHEVLSLDELHKVKTEELVPKNPPPRKCHVHDDLLKIFCFDCGTLICRDCTVKDHRDHNIEFNKVAADNKKKELLESLQTLREMKDSLSVALEAVHNAEREVEAQGTSVAHIIETSFEKLQSILEARKQLLLEESRNNIKEKINSLKGQSSGLSIAKAEVYSVVDYTEQFVRHCSDDEVMSMHVEIVQKIQLEIEKCSKLEKIMEPEAVADMGVEVDCAMALQQLCEKNAKIMHLKDYLVVDKVTSKAEVDKESKVTLSTSYKEPIDCKVKFECQLKSVHEEACVKTNIEPASHGEFHVLFTPVVRGRHKLCVKINGQSVSGSPFPILVSLSPAQLDKPLKVWDGLSYPVSVAINSAEEIVVAEYGGNVVVLDKDGKKLRHIECSQIAHLQSAALDNEDTIYFIDRRSNKIVTASKNCKESQVHCIEQIHGPGHIAVAIVGDEVMLTERSNEGQLMVYDRNLKYVRHIVGKGTANLMFISPDSQGNLYVSDDNGNIQIFSKAGSFLCSIKTGITGPASIFVSGYSIYVGDFSSKYTAVFSTDGEYVTRFGSYGGVCTDADGFLYVCDYFNNMLCSY